MAAREQRNDSDLDHILVPVEGSLQNETTTEDALSSTAQESGTETAANSEFSQMKKPYTCWSEEDFPDKADQHRRGLNKILQLYVNVRAAIFKPQSVYDDTDEVCCDGIGGLCGLIFVLLADVAFVAYSCSHKGWRVEENVQFIVLSIAFLIVILVKIFRRLLRLAHTKGECFAFAISIERLCYSLTNGLVRFLASPWRAVWSNMQDDEKAIQRRKSLVKISIAGAVMLGFTIFCIIYYVALVNVRNLISLSGIGLLLLVSILLSRFPNKINWQPVLICLFLQILLAFITLKTRVGYVAFRFLGDKVAAFLSNSLVGSQFLFGNISNFAFTVLPVVIFFSSITAVCFHLGIIQLIIEKPSVIAMKFMKTTGPETINAMANIFLSMTEAPLITRPYLPLSTNSELHAMLVNGFASISGSVMAAFIQNGIPANHLLIACVMSAPAALGVSKILYPEVKVSHMAKEDFSFKLKSSYQNVIEAAMVGALDGVQICAGIVGNLIAFLSIYNFLNSVLIWLGNCAHLPFNLTFEVLFSYILWPIAFTMGVPIEDSLKVAELIGVKTFLNEFAAYERLGVIIKDMDLFENRNASIPIDYLPDGNWRFTLTNGTSVTAQYGVLHTDKALVISTYALCGFANIGSIGILLGSMAAIIPHRRKDLANMIVVGMVGGNIACFLTGCFAGLFYE